MLFFRKSLKIPLPYLFRINLLAAALRRSHAAMPADLCGSLPGGLSETRGLAETKAACTSRRQRRNAAGENAQQAGYAWRRQTSGSGKTAWKRRWREGGWRLSLGNVL